MSKFFVSDNQIENNKIVIKGEDVNHIKNVLRINIGDSIQICDKDTSDNFLCVIENFEKETIICNIKKKQESKTESNVYINIFQGIPKAEKMEFVIQKSTELGVCEITPVVMKRCIVKLVGKDEKKKIDRWQKIAEVAAKQSGRDFIPIVNNCINICNLCEKIKNYDIVIVAYEKENENSIKNELNKLKNKSKKDLKIGVVIGPEGGIEPSEIELLKQNGAKVVTLGKRILRTETVALTLASIIMYDLGDLN